VAKIKKKKLPLVYQPVGLVLGLVSGALAGRAFRATWKAVRHEDNAPETLHRDLAGEGQERPGVAQWGPGRPGTRSLSPARRPSAAPGAA
jgi:hypothetical protein